jgi:uncharacterized heparinase superfamily protein
MVEKNSIKIKLYFYTIFYLNTEQILYRFWFAIRRIFKNIFQSKMNTVSQHPEWVSVKPSIPFVGYPWIDPRKIEQRSFRFLNETSEHKSGIDWEARDKVKLWRYNLHYFDYLNTAKEIDQQLAIQMMCEWIINNPSGITDAWAPYPVSLRIVNWLKYLQRANCSVAEATALRQSLYQQALWLEQNLERHLLGNHFFKNLKALIFVGLFFNGVEANRWLKKGVNLLTREINEQILSDGGHFERSPMYHTMILEDCLDLLNIMIQNCRTRCKKLRVLLYTVCPSMVKFLYGMLHPDGEIALFNDAAIGIELPSTKIFEYASFLLGNHVRRPQGLFWSFPESGYFVMAPTDRDRMIIDCGLIGPDYQPGHAHCDTLSYELSLDHRRVIVDSGVHNYENGSMRQYVRSTRAHNTVMVDEKEQSEIWHAFRVARRAKPIYARMEATGGHKVSFTGAHDGYKRLPGRIVHERLIEHDGADAWKVVDYIKGRGQHQVKSFIHIHPDIKASINGSTIFLLERKNNKRIASIKLSDEANLSLEQGWYCPEFGLEFRNDVIVLSKYERLPIKIGYRILKNHNSYS